MNISWPTRSIRGPVSERRGGRVSSLAECLKPDHITPSMVKHEIKAAGMVAASVCLLVYEVGEVGGVAAI